MTITADDYPELPGRRKSYLPAFDRQRTFEGEACEGFTSAPIAVVLSHLTAKSQEVFHKIGRLHDFHLNETTIVATMADHNTTIPANAQPGWCKPKKIYDQATFKTS